MNLTLEFVAISHTERSQFIPRLGKPVMRESEQYVFRADIRMTKSETLPRSDRYKLDRILGETNLSKGRRQVSHLPRELTFFDAIFFEDRISDPLTEPYNRKKEMDWLDEIRGLPKSVDASEREYLPKAWREVALLHYDLPFVIEGSRRDSTGTITSVNL